MFLAMILLLSATGAFSREVLELWPDQPPPYSIPVEDEETIDDCWGGVRCAHRVTRPTLTLYPSENNPSTWLLVAPGGGYSVVAVHHEGSDIAEAFVERGFSAAVLKYRVPDIQTATHPEKVPFADFRRAMEILRARQEDAGVDDGQIGVVGFSASGHLATYAMIHPDENAALSPDFAILVYGTSKLNPTNRDWLEKNLYYRSLSDDEERRESILDWVTEDTPPAFLVHAVDDDISHYTESTMYADALREKGVHAELHLFAHGGHGFGPGRSSDGTDQWLDLAANWIRRISEEPAKR
jgi:acetyl esterase/lipase